MSNEQLPGMMKKYVVACRMCKKETTFYLDKLDILRWQEGVHIQDVWPDMKPSDREMLISQTCSEC